MMILLCAFYCIAFTGNMIAGKTLLDDNNIFYSNDLKKNDKTIVRVPGDHFFGPLRPSKNFFKVKCYVW